MNERLKELRKALNLTQHEFADRLGISRGNIGSYEVGKSNIGGSVIALICTKFNVNESWLRTGEGEMFVKRSEEDELAQVFSAIAASDDELIKRIIRAYWKLDNKEKTVVKKLIDGFSVGSSGSFPVAPASAPARAPTIEDEARAEAEEYYRQRLMEKKAEDASSASPDDTGSDGEKMA